ncbi:hypothetical protein ACFYW6_08895 [Streptomyces sp. NPDC002659]
MGTSLVGGGFDVAPPPDNGTESTPGRFNIGLFLTDFFQELIDGGP